MATPTMTADEFAAVLPRLKRMTFGNVELVRRILVDGISQIEATRESGLTKQRINGMVNRVIAAANEVPDGWVRVELWLPPELVATAREMEQKARAALNIS